MKRRYWIFGLLGPVLGFAIVRYGFLHDTVSGFDPYELVLLPEAYIMGIIPALVAAMFDQALSDRGVNYRPLWTALAGFLIGFLPIMAALIYLHFASPWVLLWGFVGSVPALICSLLSGRSKPLRGTSLPSSDQPTPVG